MLQYDGRCCEGKLGKMGCPALCSLENGVHIWMESKQTHSQTNRQRKYTRNCWVMPSWCRCCRCCLPVKYLFDFWLMNNRWAAISFCCVCVFLCWFYVCQWQVNFGEYPIHLSTNWKNWMKMPMQRVTHQTYIHSHHTQLMCLVHLNQHCGTGRVFRYVYIYVNMWIRHVYVFHHSHPSISL